MPIALFLMLFLLTPQHAGAGIGASDDELVELSELALAMILQGDASAFSDEAFQSDPNANLGLELKLIADSRSMYCAHIVDSALWYTITKPGLDEGGNHDLCIAPILDLTTMRLGDPSTHFFDSIEVNTPKNEGFFTIQGNILFYTGCNYNIGYGDCDIMFCDLSSVPPKKFILPTSVNSKWWESQPAIDKDWTLFFASTYLNNADEGRVNLFYSLFDAASTSYSNRVRLPKHVNMYDQCTAPYVIPGTNLLMYCASTTNGTRWQFLCTTYTKDEDGELVFATPKRLPASLSAKGRPISMSYDSKTQTILLALDNGGRTQLYYARIPSSF